MLSGWVNHTMYPLLKEVEKVEISAEWKSVALQQLLYFTTRLQQKKGYHFIYHDSSKNHNANSHWIKELKLKFYDTKRITCSKVNHWERQDYWDLIKCVNVNLPLVPMSFGGILLLLSPSIFHFLPKFTWDFLLPIQRQCKYQTEVIKIPTK